MFLMHTRYSGVLTWANIIAFMFVTLATQAMEFGAIPIILQPTDPTRNYLNGK